MKYRVLYVATHGIGDLILSIPVIHALKEFGLVILTNSSNEISFLESVYGDKITYYSYNDINFINRIILIFKLILYDFEYIIPQVDISPKKFKILKFILNLGVTKDDFYYISNRSYNKLINNINIAKKYFNNKLIINYFYPTLNIKESLKINEFLKLNIYNYVLVAPGSFDKEKHKRWPADYYAKLINFLHDKYGYVFVLVGDSKEANICKEISRNVKSIIYDFSGKITINELIILVKYSKFTLSNCNSVSHISSLFNVKHFGFYGPTDYIYTGPYSTNSTQITLSLECSPCYTSTNTTGCGNPICLINLTPEYALNFFKNI